MNGMQKVDNNIIDNDTKEFGEEEEEEYTNNDNLKLLEDPSNLSAEEKGWLMDQNCETEENVLYKCRELLQAGIKQKEYYYREFAGQNTQQSTKN